MSQAITHSPKPFNASTTFGITFSGGGARGAAHIGVLKALEEFGIEPTHVVGVSAGAIVGALYAAGKKPQEMMDFIAESSMIRVIKFGIPRTGLTTMDYLRTRISEMLPENDFESLKKPLHIGVTNISAGAFELHNSGKLHDLIAASCSIPFVFKPMEIDGTLYVDGGIMNNMATLPLEGKVDYIIGSNLIPPKALEKKDLSSVISISWRCFDLSVMANTSPCTQRCDILFEPPAVADHNIFSFSKIQELYDIGYNHAKEMLERELVFTEETVLRS